MPESVMILIRSVITFVVLLALARLMGKQQLSQLTFFDYVVGITIGDIAGMMAVDQNLKMANGLIGLFVWAGFSIIMALFSIKSKQFRHLTTGQPTTVIKGGKIQEQNLKKLRITVDELMPLLREKNAFKLSDVELALMETNGKISVMKKSDNEPVTPKILGMATEQEKQPQIVIVDGKVNEKSLNKTGYTREWLLGEVMSQGASDFSDVFTAQVDSKGNVYVDLYQDKLKKPETKKRPLVAASLKKIQGDLESFASQTNDEQTKAMYAEQAQKLQKVIDSVQPYLKE